MGAGESCEADVPEEKASEPKLGRSLEFEARQISSEASLLQDAQVRAEELKGLLGNEDEALKVFARLWPLCHPSEDGLAARVEICEVLQHTVRLHGPKRSMEVGRQLALTFGGSALPVSFDEAFSLGRAAFSSIQDLHGA
jgi:hypothetical protein